MAKSFFLNYGGPGGYWYTQNLNHMQTIHEACIDDYGEPETATSWQYLGLEITVKTYGLHRALLVTMPDYPKKIAPETEALFNKIAWEARNFTDRKYWLLANNCVTSVAHVLNALDPSFTSNYVVLPWTLDKKISSYQLKPFKKTYENKNTLKYKNRLNKVKSPADIVSYVGNENDEVRERTKSVLLEIEWVTEDERKMLHPTLKAPQAFALGLNQYNSEQTHHEKKLSRKDSYDSLDDIDIETIYPWEDNLKDIVLSDRTFLKEATRLIVTPEDPDQNDSHFKHD